MTAVAPNPMTDTFGRLHYLPIGLAASVMHALMMIPGYREDGSFDTGPWVTMAVLSLVLATLIFTLVVPGGGASSAVVLGVFALLGTVAFWTMFSFPLSAAAGLVGMRARTRSDNRRMATVAVVMAVVAVVATVAITIGDGIANR
jgi:hypothetical protein